MNFDVSIRNDNKYLISKFVLIFVFFIPVSQFLSVRLIVLSLLVVLFNGASLSIFFKRAWDIVLFILIQVLGLFYSDSLYSGISVLETSFSLLAIPIIFSSIADFDRKSFEKILIIFSIGLCFSCLIYIGNAITFFYQTASVNRFLFQQFTEVLDFQPTYVAYYLVFAITLALYELNYGDRFTRSPLITAPILFFFLLLMLTGGRTSFISILFVFSFFVLLFFLASKNKLLRLTFALIVAMTTCLFVTTVFEEYSRAVTLDDSWDRYDLWESAISANENIFFGVGTADYKVVLNEYFRSHNMERYAADSLNSHNQFVHTYLSNGLLGLVAIILLLGRPLYLSFMRGYTLGILVFFPFMLYGMTEVFLGRYQGVVFFAFLHQTFISYLDSSKPAIDLKHA